MIITWPAPAKLNLFLYITGRSPNGLHNLQTLFQFLNYGDTLDIIPDNSGKITLLNTLNGVPFEKNLIVRAAKALRYTAMMRGRLSKKAGVKILLKKRLPMGGGLGGGSSDAATILVALNHLWQTRFNKKELSLIALKLGSDIPIFVNGLTSFCEGEQIQPVETEKKWYFVAYPGMSISTYNLFNDKELTRNTPIRKLDTLLKIPFHNDCESVVRKRFSKVDELLCWLTQYAPSRLTGTGSCVFSEFNTELEAHNALNLAPKWIDGFVACGLNKSPLQQVISDINY